MTAVRNAGHHCMLEPLCHHCCRDWKSLASDKHHSCGCSAATTEDDVHRNQCALYARAPLRECILLDRQDAQSSHVGAASTVGVLRGRVPPANASGSSDGARRPAGVRRAAAETSEVCLRCGSGRCPGVADHVRAGGGCTAAYAAGDLARTRCYVCGALGHPCCSDVPTTSWRCPPYAVTHPCALPAGCMLSGNGSCTQVSFRLHADPVTATPVQASSAVSHIPWRSRLPVKTAPF